MYTVICRWRRTTRHLWNALEFTLFSCTRRSSWRASNSIQLISIRIQYSFIFHHSYTGLHPVCPVTTFVTLPGYWMGPCQSAVGSCVGESGHQGHRCLFKSQKETSKSSKSANNARTSMSDESFQASEWGRLSSWCEGSLTESFCKP